MATFLLAWELGSGLGHLGQLAPLAQELTRRGHMVFAALRDLAPAGRAFAPATAAFLQAPHRVTHTGPAMIELPRTFAHILHNNGFGDATELSSLVEAWGHLFRMVRPDVTVFDHSPTALLASRLHPCQRVLIGSGFCSPPDAQPLPDLWPSSFESSKALFRAEDVILDHINSVLRNWKQHPLERVAQLYSQIDDNVLTTYPELDHYPDRHGATYWGDYQNLPGGAPRWPDGPGKKIFAYLKPFPALNELLGWLKHSDHRVLVYGNAIPVKLQRASATPRLRFEALPLDMRQVSTECDAAILNGTHSATVAFLKAGKPTFHIPIVLEQWLLAQRIVRLGAGLAAAPHKPDEVLGGLQAMLASSAYQRGAQCFAERHGNENPGDQVRGIIDLLEGLAKKVHS